MMSGSLIDLDDVQRRLLELSQRTGYEMVQKQGQRVYGGPPPGWTGDCGPQRGSEVYCYRIPRDCFEDELVPVFSSVGRIYELRLMIEFSGATRTYCYVRYCQRKDAEQAIKKLHNHEIRPGFFLAVTKSVDNRKLVIKPSPALAVGVTEEETREEISKILDGVVRVRFISSRWLELEFHSHRMAAVARRILVPGNLTMFQSIGIKQVDWADPDIEGYVTELMNNRNLCVRNLPKGIQDQQLRNFFNDLLQAGEQVENVVRTKANHVIVTFLSPEAAKSVMERGEGLEVGGCRLEISWWLDRETYSSQPRSGGSAGGMAGAKPATQMSARQQQQLAWNGPVEKLQQVSLSQGWGWGEPQYTSLSFRDSTGQQVFQYSVSVPAVPTSKITGEVSLDRHIAMMNTACAALQGIATETQRQFSQNLTNIQRGQAGVGPSSSNTMLGQVSVGPSSSNTMLRSEEDWRREANKAARPSKRLQASGQRKYF